MLQRKFRPYLAAWIAIMLAWSQIALAAHACPQSALQAAAQAAAAHCHDEADAEPSALCKTHCEQPGQSHQLPSLDLPPPALLGLWLVLPAAESAPAVRTFHLAALLPPGTPPPLRIQYQVFRD